MYYECSICHARLDAGELIGNICIECAEEQEKRRERLGIEDNLSRAGYEEIGTGIFVPEEDAYKYAMERISWDEDLKSEFVEWFYSGNWVYENGREAYT